MDTLLAPHGAYIAAYIDDIIIFTKTWPQHVRAVTVFLKELRNAGMISNPKKCVRACKETKYFRVLVGQGLNSSLADKVEAICDFKPTHSRQQMCSFLGLVNYYR